MYIPTIASSYTYDAPVVFIDGAFYVIGGIGSSSTIGKLDVSKRVWSRSGQLSKGRYSHNAIFDGENILIVGGMGTFMTEKCSFSNEQITCSE